MPNATVATHVIASSDVTKMFFVRGCKWYPAIAKQSAFHRHGNSGHPFQCGWSGSRGFHQHPFSWPTAGWL